MDTALQIIVTEIVSPMLIALLAALGAWLASRLPGPIRDFLQSAVHQRDVELIVNAMARRAADAVGRGKDTTRSEVQGDVVRYVEQVLPEVLAKLRPSEEALATMAAAALHAAATNQAIIASATLPAPSQTARVP